MERRFVVLFVLLLFVVMLGPSMLAQAVQEAAVPSPVVPHGPTAEWGSAAIWAFLSSSFLEWMKRNRAITFVSDRMAFGTQRVLGILLAIATASGIHSSFDQAAGVLTISGLIWPSVWSAITESLRQWVFQEYAYRTAVKNFGDKQPA